MVTVRPDRWSEIEAVFGEALDQPEEARDAWLRQRCGEDAELFDTVSRLLREHDRSTSFMDPDATGLRDLHDPDSAKGTLESGTLVGRYRVVEFVGRGGMGEVYRARQVDADYERDIALKVIRPGLGGSELLRRFHRERQALARLSHPGIAPLFDGGTTRAGLPFLVMEFVTGRRIDDYCQEEKLDPEGRLELFLQLCDAVDHAHKSNVIHRDIKPSNILVDEAGRAKLLDFGIARVLGPTVLQGEPTTIGSRQLTLQYASPEHVRGDPVGPAGDVYSLGMVLYELLTGEPPYVVEGKFPAEVTRLVLEAVAPRASETASNRQRAGRSAATAPARLRGDLDSILAKALEKEPHRRYESVRAFADDVQRHLDGRPLLARKHERWHSVSRRVRRVWRHPAIHVAGALLLVGVSVLLAVQSSETAAARRAHRATTFIAMEALGYTGDPSDKELVQERYPAELELARSGKGKEALEEASRRTRSLRQLKRGPLVSPRGAIVDDTPTFRIALTETIRQSRTIQLAVFNEEYKDLFPAEELRPAANEPWLEWTLPDTARLSPGSYSWDLTLNGTPMRSARFEVREPAELDALLERVAAVEDPLLRVLLEADLLAREGFAEEAVRRIDETPELYLGPDEEPSVENASYPLAWAELIRARASRATRHDDFAAAHRTRARSLARLAGSTAP